MAFKTVDQYDNDPVYSGVFNFGDIMNSALSEKFDERITWVRAMDRAKRIEVAQVSLLFIVKTVEEAITDGEEFANWLFTFMACVNELACAGLEPVSLSKKQELAEMQSVIGDTDNFISKDIFFDWKQFRDKDHQMLVHSFLGICKDPGLHQYPDCVANYMLTACCADRPNENGIKAAKYVWNEYLDYVKKVKRNPDYTYTGTYNRDHFTSFAQKETERRREAEARERAKAEEKRNLEEAKKRAERKLEEANERTLREAPFREEWVKECTEVVARRIKELEARTEKERRYLTEAATKKKLEQQKKIQERIDAYDTQRKNALQELESLKFFQFGRKKELEKNAETAGANMKKAKAEQASWENWLKKEKEEIEKKLPAYRERNRLSAYLQHPLPKRPGMMESPALPNSSQTLEDINRYLELIGMTTLEELRSILGTFVTEKELDILQKCGMAQKIAVGKTDYYISVSDMGIRNDSKKKLQTADALKKKKIEEDKVSMRLTYSRSW